MNSDEIYEKIIKTNLALNKPIIDIIGEIRTEFAAPSHSEEVKALLHRLLLFVTKMQLSLSDMRGKDIGKVAFVPVLKEHYRIEFFGIAKMMVQKAGFTMVYAPAASAEETALIIHRRSFPLIVCDGCRVRHPHPHSCHKGQMSMGIHCECQECLETNTFQLLGIFRHDGWSDMQDYLKNIAGFYATPE